MNDTNNSSLSTKATAKLDPATALGDKTAEHPKEHWYQRFGKSVGSRIGICASALVVVALASGLSAYAGASVASNDPGHNAAHIERNLDKDDARGLGQDNGKGADCQQDRNSDDMHKSQKSDTSSSANSNGGSNVQSGKNASERGAA